MPDRFRSAGAPEYAVGSPGRPANGAVGQDQWREEVWPGPAM